MRHCHRTDSSSLENNVTQTMKKKWTMPDNRPLAAMFGINID